MDTRRWASPKIRRCLKTVFLVCFLVHHVTADYPPILDRQGLSESTADSRHKFEALNHFIPFSSEQDTDYKRSSAFFPLRGKKLTAVDMDTANYPFMSQQGDAEEKRSQFYPLRGKKIPDELKRGSYFMPMRGRKDDANWSEDEDNVDKRMSSFMPMRGKKKSGFLDTFPHLGKPGTYSTEIMYPSSSGSNRKKREANRPAGLDNKTIKASEKLSNGNETSHLVQKRSVSFMPMRGRNEYESLGSQEIKTRLLEKKSMTLFYDNLLRKFRCKDSNEKKKSMTLFNENFLQRYHCKDSNEKEALDPKFDDKSSKSSQNEAAFREANQQPIHNDEEKSSVVPIRGGKTSYDVMSSVEYSEAPQEDKRRSNFMPMRGRKNYMDEADTSNEHIYPDDKRASSFMPMRGRRNLEDFEDFNTYETDSDDKRAPSVMPMEGQKEYLEEMHNFEDILNKRSSYFMPMRGRRRSVDDSFVKNQVKLSRKKRTSSFMPMRGRKFDSSSEDFLEKKSSSFMPMRGRRDLEDILFQNPDEKRGFSFMPMRGRREAFGSTYNYNGYPFLVSSGIGSSLMTRHYNGDFYPVSSVRRYVSKTRKFDWDSVKRAFHATRGKRFEVGKDSEEVWEPEEQEDNDPQKCVNGKGCRYKRSILRPRTPMKPQRQYIALKRPMSFFATRGKRLDDSAIDSTVSNLR